MIQTIDFATEWFGANGVELALQDLLGDLEIKLNFLQSQLQLSDHSELQVLTANIKSLTNRTYEINPQLQLPEAAQYDPLFDNNSIAALPNPLPTPLPSVEPSLNGGHTNSDDNFAADDWSFLENLLNDGFDIGTASLTNNFESVLADPPATGLLSLSPFEEDHFDWINQIESIQRASNSTAIDGPEFAEIRQLIGDMARDIPFQQRSP